MEALSIMELKRMDLKGATVIDGFPSVGLVSSIVANYLVNSLELEQIGILDSIYFPSVSLVRKAEPLNTVRIYASEPKSEGDKHDQLVVFISEFQPPNNLIKVIAKTMLDWIQENKCKQLICPEGLVIEREGGGKDNEEENEGEKEDSTEPVYGIASTKRGRKVLEDHNIALFQEGVITGIAGVLLNEGKIRDFDVLSLLAEANPEYPDARAAATVIEAIDKLLLHIKLDAQPLFQEAEDIESQLRNIQKQTKVIKQIPLPHMYG
jgi:uncharacterized protein